MPDDQPYANGEAHERSIMTTDEEERNRDKYQTKKKDMLVSD